MKIIPAILRHFCSLELYFLTQESEVEKSIERWLLLLFFQFSVVSEPFYWYNQMIFIVSTPLSLTFSKVISPLLLLSLDWLAIFYFFSSLIPLPGAKTHQNHQPSSNFSILYLNSHILIQNLSQTKPIYQSFHHLFLNPSFFHHSSVIKKVIFILKEHWECFCQCLKGLKYFHPFSLFWFLSQ